MPPFLYLFLGAMAIVSALGVVVQRNPIHSLLSLISTLLIIAIFFIAGVSSILSTLSKPILLVLQIIKLPEA